MYVAQIYAPISTGHELLGYEETMRALLERAQAVADRTLTKLGAAGLALESRVRRGDPSHEIVEEAKSWGADLIVVGSHGRTGMQRLLLGSVAEQVVRHAPCSVEVVRQPKS